VVLIITLAAEVVEMVLQRAELAEMAAAERDVQGAWDKLQLQELQTLVVAEAAVLPAAAVAEDLLVEKEL
jgi:hypothetical protein